MRPRSTNERCPLNYDISACSDDLCSVGAAFNSFGQLERSWRATLGEVIEVLDLPEIQSGALFQIGDANLSSRYVERLLESRQVSDVFLAQHESRSGWRFVLTYQDADLPELERAADGVVHPVVLINRVVCCEKRAGDDNDSPPVFLCMLLEKELFQSLPAVLPSIECRSLQ